MLDKFLESLADLPLLARFAFALTVLLTMPALCRRIRFPAVVGLLAAGVIFGPYGLHVGPKHYEVAEYFAEVGKRSREHLTRPPRPIYHRDRRKASGQTR